MEERAWTRVEAARVADTDDGLMNTHETAEIAATADTQEVMTGSKMNGTSEMHRGIETETDEIETGTVTVIVIVTVEVTDMWLVSME